MPNKNKRMGFNPITQGHSGITSEKLKRVNLPEKIKCHRCSRFKANTAFSNKQLADLRHSIYTNGQMQGSKHPVRCMDCTGQQVTELHCYICDEWKEVNSGFAKAQRRNPDHAKCWDCMKEQLDHDPEAVKGGDSDEDSQPDSDDLAFSDEGEDYSLDGGPVHSSSNTDASTTYNDDASSSVWPSSITNAGSVGGVQLDGYIATSDFVQGGWQIQGSKGKISAVSKLGTGANTTTSNSTKDSSGWSGTPGGVGLSSRPSPRPTPSATGSGSAWASPGWNPNGWNPNKYGNPRAPASVAGSVASSAATGRASASSKWAKVKAYKEPPKPAAREEDGSDGEADDEWNGVIEKGDSDESDDDNNSEDED